MLGLQMRRCVLQPLNLTAVLFPSRLASCALTVEIKRLRAKVDMHISEDVCVCVCICDSVHMVVCVCTVSSAWLLHFLGHTWLIAASVLLMWGSLAAYQYLQNSHTADTGSTRPWKKSSPESWISLKLLGDGEIASSPTWCGGPLIADSNNNKNNTGSSAVVRQSWSGAPFSCCSNSLVKRAYCCSKCWVIDGSVAPTAAHWSSAAGQK